jgi:hypothetical protein
VSNPQRPAYSSSCRREDLRLPEHSSYLYAATGDTRGQPPNSWISDCQARSISLIELGAGEEDCLIWKDGSGEGLSNLRDTAAVDGFLSGLASPLFLDITGLPLSLWAPLIPRVQSLRILFRAIYVEPNAYARSDIPSPWRPFDLSERINGIAPIPSFASLRRPSPDSVALVPILGFEGARLEFVLQEAELPSEQVFPVLGSPGFRLEYPTFALLGNADALVNDQLSLRLALARASCPFDLFDVVDKIYHASQMPFMRIAPLGTKPHALGAILYATAARTRVEILYDNAIPRRGMSQGSSNTWTYFVSEFMDSSLFLGALT